MNQEGSDRQGKDLSPPHASKRDIAHGLLKAGFSAIPLAGGPAAELFAMLITPPLERRREEWMEDIGEALTLLMGHDLVDLGRLQEDDEFLDTVLQASQVALRNHQEEKRAALRGAIMNTAIGQSPGEALRLMFIGFIDYFTEWHLRVLFLFDEPRETLASLGQGVPNLYMGDLEDVLEHAYPELRNSRTICDRIWSDLYQRGLVNTDGLHTTMTGDGVLQSRTTDLGKRFLAFIQEPALDS